MSKAMQLLNSSDHLFDHDYNEVHAFTRILDLLLPMLECKAAICHQDLADIVFVDHVTEHVRECVILFRSIFNYLIQIKLLLLALQPLQFGEDLKLSKDPFQIARILLQHDPYAEA